MQTSQARNHNQEERSEFSSEPLSEPWLDRLSQHLRVHDMSFTDGVVLGPSDLVANFLPLAIASGECRYLGGRAVPRHLVAVVRPATDEARANGEVLCKDLWELKGDLRKSNTWADGSNGRAIIAHERKFKVLVHVLVDLMGVQARDERVDKMLVVGTYLTESGDLRVSDGVEFPAGDEECPYAGTVFPRQGDRHIFEKVAALSTDGTVEASLVWALGAAFKPAFGDAYPHLVLTGDKEAGKTTLFQVIARRFGLKVVAAPVHFQTSYRTKKALANTNVPVLADEVGRLGSSHRKRLVDQLNVSYNIGPTTHGHKDRVYDLYAPVLLAGQDFPARDEALLSKTIAYHLVGEAKNENALEELERDNQVFPLGEWLEFTCEYGNEHDIPGLLREKEALLRTSLSDCPYAHYSEMDRCFRNYAMQLVAADALQAYGIDADIEDYIVEALRQHLEMLREEGIDIAARFVHDLVVLLATRPDPSKTLCDEGAEGVHVHIETAMRALRSMGYTYDVSDPRVITRRLKEKGLGETTRHRFGGHQLRCLFIPREVLAAAAAEEAETSPPASEAGSAAGELPE